MKKVDLFVSVIIILLFFFAGCNQGGSTTETTAAGTISKDSLVRKGSYLVNVIGCDHCHTPKIFGPKGPEPDMSRRFSGNPADGPDLEVDTNVIKKGNLIFSGDLTSFAGPWGVSYAANLTNDETGIRNWTIEHFRRALKQGLFHGMEGSRTLLPPMPWESFREMQDEDLDAIFEYLKSTKPVKNVVRNARPPMVTMAPPPAAK